MLNSQNLKNLLWELRTAAAIDCSRVVWSPIDFLQTHSSLWRGAVVFGAQGQKQATCWDVSANHNIPRIAEGIEMYLRAHAPLLANGWHNSSKTMNNSYSCLPAIIWNQVSSISHHERTYQHWWSMLANVTFFTHLCLYPDQILQKVHQKLQKLHQKLHQFSISCRSRLALMPRQLRKAGVGARPDYSWHLKKPSVIAACADADPVQYCSMIVIVYYNICYNHLKFIITLNDG